MMKTAGLCVQFQVKQELARYDFCQTQIEECDRELEQQLQSLPELRAGEEKSGTEETQRPSKKRKRRKDGNIPRFDLHHELQRISGVDLTRIDGIDVMTGQTVISEVGLDMSRWPKIISHPGSDFCPSNELSGGRILKKQTRKVVNRAAAAFRMAASTLRTFVDALVHPKQSPSWPAPWPSSSTACSSLDNTTWIAEPSSMNKDSETSSSNTYKKRLLNSASKSLQYRRLQSEFLERVQRDIHIAPITWPAIRAHPLELPRLDSKQSTWERYGNSAVPIQVRLVHSSGGADGRRDNCFTSHQPRQYDPQPLLVLYDSPGLSPYSITN
jgi:hypothetical protein